MTELRDRRRPRGPLRARHGHEALLRVPQRVRRRAEHEHLPRLPRPARLAARAQPPRRRARAEDRRGPQLSARAARSSTGRTTSIPTCRRTTRSASTTSRSTSTASSSCPTVRASASSGRTWKRTRARRPMSAEGAASTRPTIRSSTTTGPACPLVEIVSRPDIRSAAQARAYVDELRSILVATGASDGRMEEGSLRVDANVSVRPGRLERVRDSLRGEEPELPALAGAGHRLRGRAPDRTRRVRARRSPKRPATSTRVTELTHSLRSKEEANDYRYFPEPDLTPLVPDRRAAGGGRPRASDRCRPSAGAVSLQLLEAPTDLATRRDSSTDQCHRRRPRPRRARACRPSQQAPTLGLASPGRRTRRPPTPRRHGSSTRLPSPLSSRWSPSGQLSATQSKEVLARADRRRGVTRPTSRAGLGFEQMDTSRARRDGGRGDRRQPRGVAALLRRRRQGGPVPPGPGHESLARAERTASSWQRRSPPGAATAASSDRFLR